MPQHLAFDHLVRVGEVIPITIDYATELGSDEIQSSTWTVPTGSTQLSATTSGKTATLWLTGVTDGAKGVATNTLTSVGGKVLVRRQVVLIVT